MAVGDIYEIKFQTQAFAQLGLNVRHYRVLTSTAPEPSLTVIATTFATAFSPLYLPLLSDQASYAATSAKRIFPLPASLEQIVFTGAGAGTGTGGLLPKQTSGIITLRSALAGRRNRGRTFVPFPSEDQNTTSAQPTVGYFALLTLLAAGLVADRNVVDGAGSITLRPVIWRRASSSSIDVTSTLPRTVWATQRRRGDYGRQNPAPA